MSGTGVRVSLAMCALVAAVDTAMGSSDRPAGAPVAFASLPGFASDDHVAALLALRASCSAKPSPRAATPPPRALNTVCAQAAVLPRVASESAARAFFETWFTPVRLEEDGFVTGYYEPVVDGALTKTQNFATPLYPRPTHLEPMPDRAQIEAGALGRLAPLAYVRDPVDAFFIQVQGSARIRLPNGSLRRLVFDGRNGYPYTSIGKVLVQELGIPPEQMGMAQLRAWIRANGQRPGEPGATLMQRNRSYIFFRFDDTLPSHAGPIGGEGISLTPFRSLAIDRAIWSYGLPFYVDAMLPWRSDTATPFQRLMVAQDTGSAILGRARGDIFFGSGAEAARLAGPIRHRATLTVLWPRAAPATPDDP